jgi:uridine monophosphate synthetase
MVHDSPDVVRLLAVEPLIVELFHCGVIKFGSFVLKSGEVSNIYFDIRSIISHPYLLNKMASLYCDRLNFWCYDVVAGVPYSGIPIASAISLQQGKSQLIVRNVQKQYGTMKQIEGNFTGNTICLLIDDVVTTGGSLKEQETILLSHGIKKVIKLVFIDRRDTVDEDDDVVSIIKKSEVLDILKKHGLIEFNLMDKLNEIIRMKQSRLILAADVHTYRELIKLVEYVSTKICMVKVHSDLIENYDAFDFYRKSIEQNFLIMDDRKFADIGSIVKEQYNKIFKYCHIVTCHGVMGPSSILGIQAVLHEHDMINKRAVFLVASVSTDDNLIDANYSNNIVRLALQYNNVVKGLISQKRLHGSLLHATPGINLSSIGDNLGQTYQNNLDTDFIIVGRGIYEANYSELDSTAEKYRQLLIKL